MVCPICRENLDAKNKCVKCNLTWKSEELCYVGRIFHDLRRSAVRDLVRSGVSQHVAMSISGHRTAAMFGRYNITDDRDQRQALRDVQEYRKAMAESAIGEQVPTETIQ
jgi:hypothetical protein